MITGSTLIPRAAAAPTTASVWVKLIGPSSTGWAAAQLNVVRTACTPVETIVPNTGARLTPASSSGPSTFMPTKPNGVAAGVAVAVARETVPRERPV